MSRWVTDTIEELRPYVAGKPVEELARELGITDAIKLASNENPLGPSPKAIEAARSVLREVHRYPDAAYYTFRERLAEFHGVEMNDIVAGNGSNELIDLLIRTFTTGEHHVVFADPSFVVYKLSSMAHGVPFTAVPLTDLTHDVDKLLAAVRPETRLLFVANPNNPTGTHVGRAAVEKLLREAPEHVIVVMDEAYIQYADADDYPDSLELRGLREHLVVLRTFSKVYGLAAMRIGYGVAPSTIVGYLDRVRAPFNLNIVGQAAALAALGDEQHVHRSVEMNGAERRRLLAELPPLGLAVAPSQANFVYADLGRPAGQIYDALLKKGVIVRVVGPTSVRITVGTPKENDRLLETLPGVLS